MPECPTIKIMPSHPSQGAFVEINASDFDPAKHVRHVGAAPLPPPPAPLPPPPPAADPLANLPRDWRERKTGWLRALAEQVNEGRTPETREQAIQVIEKRLNAR